MGGYELIFIQPILTHTTKFKKIQLQTTNRMLERFIYKHFLLERDVCKQLRACPPFLLLPVYIPSRERRHKDRLPVIIPARDRKSINMVIQCKNYTRSTTGKSAITFSREVNDG